MDADAQSELRALLDCARAGRHDDLQARALAATARWPALTLGWQALGLALSARGRPAEALPAWERALALNPDDADLQVQRALTLAALGRVAEADAACAAALAIDPLHADALATRGDLDLRHGRPADAEACYRAALAQRPDAPALLNNLGVALKNQGRFGEALDTYRRALALQPDAADVLANQGVALHQLGRLTEAEVSLRRAIALRPDQAAACSNLGLVLMDQGRLAEAELPLRRAIALDPGLLDAHSNLLFALNHSARIGPAEALAEARAYGDAVAARVPRPCTQWRCEPEPRHLRVGLVSGDLREHAVGYFLDAVLPALGAHRIELLAYPTRESAVGSDDALAARLRSAASAWRPLTGLSDAEAAAAIHADGVHLLLDLAGHTRHHRLPVFAWKPAPVQASWLGYFASTGVAAIDALIADEVSVPPEHEPHFSERVWRLPVTRLCFTPPADAPPVAPLPALRRGHVTFGCFQTAAKLHDAVLDTWADLLARVPGARLRLQGQGLGDESVARRLRERFAARGIAADRIALHAPLPRAAYLAAHAEVDLLLDTFPYPGGTTTCEALWMGLPTVTLAGDRLIARQGASLLRAAGLDDWIVPDRDGYIATAIARAGDLATLAALRARLRDQVRVSALCDAPRFAAELAALLWRLWAAHGAAGRPRVNP